MSENNTHAPLEIAREAIRHTMSVYNNAGDRGDFDAFVGTFTPTATLELYGRRHAGHEEIRAFATSALKPQPGAAPREQKLPVRHHTTTSRIEVTEAGKASGWTYFIVSAGGSIVGTGMYVDTFEKTDGRWLISSRRVKLDGE